MLLHASFAGGALSLEAAIAAIDGAWFSRQVGILPKGGSLCLAIVTFALVLSNGVRAFNSNLKHLLLTRRRVLCV